MKNFVLGFATCWVVWKYSSQITRFLEIQLAKLELKRDMLKHDNPDLD